MKFLLKFTVYVFLFVMTLFSCQKQLQCPDCPSNSATNKLPIANAGADQRFILPKDSVLLDGTASKDPDGKIVLYNWVMIQGPVYFTVISSNSSKTLIKNLVTGIYQFELTVTDNGGLSAKDTMQIIVDPGPTSNHPPVACAGQDQSITLPTNSVTLNGSCSTDPDNNITSYIWAKISGPSSFNIANANEVTTSVTTLTAGSYLFELKVTDAAGLIKRYRAD